jgi:hypothetical protein
MAIVAAASPPAIGRLKNIIRFPKVLTMHDHRTIFSCIERRDAAGAEAAMLNHLVRAEMKLLQSELDSAPQGAGRASGRRTVVSSRQKSQPPAIMLRGRAKA